jgi:phage tail sheath gpL-like
MTASFPGLLTSGVDDLGRFDPFEVIGPGPVRDSQGQAADGVAIQQFEVLTYDEDGRVIPWAGTGYYASGSVTFTGVPAANGTVDVNGETITFVDGVAGAGEVTRDGGLTATQVAQAFKDLINADPTTYGVTASGAALVILLTAIVEGTDGNSIVLTESASNLTVDGSGTLSGASDTAGSIPAGVAVAVAMQAVEAATPGGMLPIRVMGSFNHEKLIWPDGVATIAQRRMAMAGTPLTPLVFL